MVDSNSLKSEHIDARLNQVGIMLQGNRVESTLIGGPAFDCGKIKKDDVIVKVDGIEVLPENPEDFLAMLIGEDEPGSKLVLTVCPPESIERTEIEIPLNRMKISDIADRRIMFEHFTYLQVILKIHLCLVFCHLIKSTH
jgi:C-terminal processing protease CtpA/Prc